DDDLGVGERPERVAARDQTLAQLAEVVDLAVEDDAHGAVFIRHRLIGGGAQVDDAQAAEAEANARRRGHVQPLVVRPSMHEAIAHGHDRLGADRRAVERQFTADATHYFLYAGAPPPAPVAARLFARRVD